MALIELVNVDYSVGGPLLLERVNFSLEPRERVAILGRNGAGKSTFLKLMQGTLKADDGDVRQNGRVATLAQEVPPDTHGSIEEVIASGLGELGHYVAEFHALSHQNEPDQERMGEVQSYIDTHDGWLLESRIAQVLSRLQLNGELAFAGLSGGMKRRVLLAQALVTEPDVLLLDEPTNHLDLESITAFNNSLKNFKGSVLFTTHDHEFAQTVANRVLEITPNGVIDRYMTFDEYLDDDKVQELRKKMYS